MSDLHTITPSEPRVLENIGHGLETSRTVGGRGGGGGGGVNLGEADVIGEQQLTRVQSGSSS